MHSRRIFYGWWIVAGCFVIACTVIPLLMAMYNKFLLQVTADMNLSRSSFTFSHSLTNILGIIMSPIAARELSRGNFRLKITLSLTCFCAAYFSYSLAQEVWHLYISSFFTGLFFLGTTMIPLSMMITNWFVKRRGAALSIVMTGIGIGGFLLSPLITYFLETYGWRTSYQLLAGIVFLLCFPMCAFVLRHKPGDMGLEPYGAGEEKERAVPAYQIRPVHISVRESYTTPFFLLLILGSLATGFVTTGTVGQFPPALEEKFGPAFQAKIISMYSIIGIFGKLFIGWVNDRMGVIKGSACSCLAIGSAVTCMLLASSQTGMYTMAVLFGLGSGLSTLSLPLLTAAIYGPEKYSHAFGIVSAALQVGFACGSFSIAGIYDMTGSYNLGWMLLIGLTATTLMSWTSAYRLSRRYAGLPAQPLLPSLAHLQPVAQEYGRTAAED